MDSPVNVIITPDDDLYHTWRVSIYSIYLFFFLQASYIYFLCKLAWFSFEGLKYKFPFESEPITPDSKKKKTDGKWGTNPSRGWTLEKDGKF